MSDETVTMTAEFEGKTYQCMFREGDQYQDVSSDEFFYYHGGVEPAFGDKSGFYFLVFVIYDNTLAAAIPMRGVTAENYDSKFDSMICWFESSSTYKTLYSYHLNRCASNPQ